MLENEQVQSFAPYPFDPPSPTTTEPTYPFTVACASLIASIATLSAIVCWYLLLYTILIMLKTPSSVWHLFYLYVSLPVIASIAGVVKRVYR